MAFTSLTFVAFVMAVVLLCSLFTSAITRATVLLAANVVFIGSYVDNPLQVLPLAAFLLLGYVGVEAVRRTRSRTVLFVFIFVIVAFFIILKKFSFLEASMLLPFPYLIVGLSYVLFRLLHLLVDAQQGEIPARLPSLEYFNYTCNFLTFVAGPIQRYGDFLRYAETPRLLDADLVFAAFARMMRGFVKVAVVSAIFKYLFDATSTKLLDLEFAAVWVQLCGLFMAAALLYTVYLYANFAGYMDIVIGIGVLIGLPLPENFNSPFLARSFLDFWARWHMTLSEWFKTYLFNPILTLMARRFSSAKVGPYLGVVAFFLTFLIMGVWHGTTVVFVIYGLLMGAGASVNKLWQVLAVKRLGKKRYKALADKAVAIVVARGLTLAYFSIVLTCLWVDMAQLQRLWHQLGVAGFLLAYGCLAAGTTVAFVLRNATASLVRPVTSRIACMSGGIVTRNFWLAAQILLIFTVSSFFHKAPEFVYRAF